MGTNVCLVCAELLSAAPTPRGSQDAIDYQCPNCGDYALSGSFKAMLDAGPFDRRERAILAHAIRKIDQQGDKPLISTQFAKSVLEEGRLPGVEEQLENLILYFGRVLPEPGATIDLHASHMRAILGCITERAAGWVVKQAHELDLVQGSGAQSINGPYELSGATLSVRGWESHRQLLAGGSQSRRAFMAMKFGDTELDSVFLNHFKPACKRAGFELIRLDEEPKAGLIDDRLRVEIRRSRFLVADLTHANPGAYWEAGYAEGLGRPVIYTCRKDVFDDFKQRPHFDTNHHLTVVWEPENLADAASRLATTVRVTLPGESTLSDE